MKNSKDYPFTITSSNKNSKTKGVVLGLASLIFVTLLAINLLRTIFSDPGYFPSALDLEYQIVMKNLHHQQESEKQDNSENTKTEDDIKKDKNLDKDNSYVYNEDLINDVEDLEKEKKRNYFKVETPQKDKTANNKEIRPKLKKNASEKIYFEQEDSIEIYKDDALNLLNFNDKISESPICYEEYNKRADFLEEWNYRVQTNKTKEKEKKAILNGSKKVTINKESETDLDIININLNNNNNQNGQTLIKENEVPISPYDSEAFDGYVGYDVGKAFLCGTCVRLKVERSHHCKQCGKCVLKMDHHCPWLANCIGYKNYKFFLLTHLYGTISCFIVLSSYWETFVNATDDISKSIVVLSWHLFIYVCTVGLFSFLVWLLVVNWSLMFQGLTVIENADRERFPSAKFKNNFDLGYYRNFKHVFGENPLIWFLPIFPYDKYRGLYFEKNDAKHEKLMMLL